MISIDPISIWADDSLPTDASLEGDGLQNATIFSEIGNAQAFGFLYSQDEADLETEMLDGDDPSLTDHDTTSLEFSSAAMILPFFWHGYRSWQKRIDRHTDRQRG